MRKYIFFAIVLLLVVSGSIAVFFIAKLFVVPRSGLNIDTNPPSTVFVDGKKAGETPFSEIYKKGEKLIRLEPKDSSLASWEGKVRLVDNVETVIRRDFGQTENLSSGYILSFEKIGGNNAELAVVSRPDYARVEVDGEVKGYAPLKIKAITSGEHSIGLTLPGYLPKDIQGINVKKGYRLTVYVDLAEDISFIAEATPSAEQARIMVEILPTPTGFLRVREKDLLSSSEVGRVKPGERYVLLEENKDGTWYKIEYQQGRTGWIFARYAQKLSDLDQPNATDSGSLSD